MLKQLRKFKGKTQEDLAIATGKTQSSYSRFESKYFEEHTDTLLKIAKELGICPYAFAAWVISCNLGNKCDIDDVVNKHTDCSKCPFNDHVCVGNKKE